MLHTQPVTATASAGTSITVDLIGDLDETLATIVADRLETLVDEGTTDIVVATRYVTVPSSAGIATLDAACVRARERGARVWLEPGNRAMRTAFGASHVAIGLADPATRRPNARHLMLARHAQPKTLARSA